MLAASRRSATQSSTPNSIDEALAEYAQAVSLNPNDSDIIVEYADALVYAERPEQVA